MKVLELKEIQKIAFENLCLFHRFCIDHNINYWLAFGTLLGSVRHKDFIPWDDDIDVWVDVDGFFKLQKFFRNVDGYSFTNIFDDSNFIWPWGKIQKVNTLVIDKNLRKHQLSETPRGIAIDVFPLIPIKNKRKLKYINFIIRFWSLMQDYKFYRLAGFKKVVCSILSFCGFNDRHYIKLINKLMNKSNHNNSKYLVPLMYNITDKYIFERNWFIPKKQLLFCDNRFFCPGNYDMILTKIYNDYMVPPSSENRVSNHPVSYYLLDENEKQIDVLKKYYKERSERK